MKIMCFFSRLSIILTLFLCQSLNASAQNIESEIFNFIDQKNWTRAEELAKSTGDSALIKIVKSQKYLDSNCDNSFEEVVNFINTNPRWPNLEKLKVKIEKYLNDTTNEEAILQWFAKNKPRTGKGHKYYARAASKLLHDNKSVQRIKNGWIYSEFNADEERKYLTELGKFLNEEDHVKRIDEHLWSENVEEAKRSLHLVSNGYKKAFQAAIAAMDSNREKEALFERVPEQYYTSSLLYYYLKSKKKEEPTATSIILFKKVKIDEAHSREWSKLQLYYAREFIDLKDFASSYKIITIPFAHVDEDVREAEWLAGWMALRFLKKSDLALKHFQGLLAVSKKPISIARGKYWLGRTYEAKGDKQNSIKFYKDASIYPYTFYGQVAHIELKQNTIKLPHMPSLQVHHRKSIEKNDVFRAVKLLLKYGKQELAHCYAKSITEHAKPEELVWLAELVKTIGNTYYITDFGKYATQQHIFLKDYAFPTPYKISNHPVEAAITYSIIRQESVFNQYAVSTAHAMGLMQLIKDTACRTAKAVKIRCDVSKLTRDPAYNIKLGTNQLSMLMKERKGSLILTFASYNAASCKVNKWLERFGDLRDFKDYRDVLDWMELIPFSETRNYVQRVLENLQVYRAILNKNNKLKLKQDLGV
jgi:soluble lytic murein transglycosylase